MPVEALHADLIRLRSGAGLQSRQLGVKVGSALRQACAVEPIDDDGQIRTKVTHRISVLAERLASDDARAVRVALYIAPECRFRFFKDRMDCLGHIIDRERRTAVRRVDDAFQLLAELLDATPLAQRDRSRFAPDGWYFDRLSSTLLIEDERLVLTERRRITSTVDSLDCLSVGWSTSQSSEYDPGFAVRLLDGGVLVPTAPRDGAWLGEVRLNRPLAAGESHEYSTEVTQTGHVEPYYIVTPFRRTDRFEARVRFATSTPPDRAWRVLAEPARFVDEGSLDRESLKIDENGELVTSFEQLDIGLSYGVRW